MSAHNPNLFHSTHACSHISLFSGSPTKRQRVVHGLVNTFGSVIVAVQWIVFASMGVTRSTTVASLLVKLPLRSNHAVTTSTTSVSPSHVRRESPIHHSIGPGRCGVFM